uniref:Secreted protein n=1 Tax=Macrostomum lignano TaxID=282301 RepID=A0A1I8FW16_9PLAT
MAAIVSVGQLIGAFVAALAMSATALARSCSSGNIALLCSCRINSSNSSAIIIDRLALPVAPRRQQTHRVVAVQRRNFFVAFFGGLPRSSRLSCRSHLLGTTRSERICTPR